MTQATKRFSQYTDAELLSLSNETINDAIHIEAIERGIQPPITLSEALRKSEWRGYQRPAQAIEIFEVVMGKDYGTHNTGLAYLSKEKAEAALDGAVFVEHDTYGQDKGWKMKTSIGASVVGRWIGISKAEQAWAKFTEFTQDTEAFDKVRDECITRLSDVNQREYNRRVNAQKKAEYLRLAGGNEEIAKGFWAKVERTEWPHEPNDPPVEQPEPTAAIPATGTQPSATDSTK